MTEYLGNILVMIINQMMIREF